MALLTIPDPVREALSQVASLDDNQAHELLEVLRAAKPATYRSGIVPQITNKIQTITQDETEEIVEALFGLSVGRYSSDVSFADFVDDVVNSVQDLDEEARQVFRKRLTDLLDVDCLKLGAKAYELLFEHEHNFLNARILTDVRPLFGESTEDSPIGAIIVHTLRINYVQTNRPQSFYVALDERDVKKLLEILERAKTKATALKGLLATAKVPHVGME